jgi:hypothetical protein
VKNREDGNIPYLLDHATAVWSPERMCKQDTPMGYGALEIPSISIETFNAGVGLELRGF